MVYGVFDSTGGALDRASSEPYRRRVRRCHCLAQACSFPAPLGAVAPAILVPREDPRLSYVKGSSYPPILNQTIGEHAQCVAARCSLVFCPCQIQPGASGKELFAPHFYSLPHPTTPHPTPPGRHPAGADGPGHP